LRSFVTHPERPQSGQPTNANVSDRYEEWIPVYRATLVTLLLLLCSGWAVPGQQSDRLKISVQGANEKKDQPGQALANDIIIQLVNAGLDDDTIVGIVNTQPGRYLLAAEDIIRLQKAGVSGRVIRAMVNRSANSQPVASPPAPAPSPSAAVAGPLKPPSPPHIPGMADIPGPDAPAIPAPVLPVPPSKMTFFDDAAYHNCLGRHALVGDPCPPLEEHEKVYHRCLDEPRYGLSYDDFQHACAMEAADPAAYVRTHPMPPETIAIAKVRRVYIDKFFGRRLLRRALSKAGTCMEIVDSPEKADAVLKVVNELMEYSENGTDLNVTCSSSISA
jgi:hypothetical protein